MRENNYTPPVSKLLTYGNPRKFKGWPTYANLGITAADIPELIRMATDERLFESDDDAPDEIWAPVHAWRALGQLNAAEAIVPLTDIFWYADEEDDWVVHEMPVVFGMIGPEAIPYLEAYAELREHGIEPRMVAISCINMIGEKHPDARDTCVAALTRLLENFMENPPEMNGSVIWGLIDLRATEALPVIREAYGHDRVDFIVAGDIEDVEIEMGVREKRETEASYPGILDQYPGLADKLSQVTGKKKKIGRNEPCPCGSGKKYKKCCLGKREF